MVGANDDGIFQNVELVHACKVLLDGLQLCVLPTAMFATQLATRVTVLDISNNKFQTLPDALQTLVTLEHLYAYSNLLLTVNPNIKYLTKLKVLDLSRNNIKVIPDELCFLKNLNYVNFSGNDITILPKSLLSLPKLKHLHLIRNLKLRNIPREIVVQGLSAMRLYFNIVVSDHMLLQCSLELAEFELRSYLALNDLVNLFSQQVKLVHDFRSKIQSKQKNRLLEHTTFVKQKQEISSLLEASTCDRELTTESQIKEKYPVNSRTNRIHSTSEYGSLSQVEFEKTCFYEDIESSLSTSCCSCTSEYQNESFESTCSITDTSFDCDSTQCSYLNACKDLVVQNMGVQLTLPKRNMSGHEFYEFTVDVIHDDEYEPKLDLWSTLASNVIHLGPHGSKFYPSLPAVVKLQISAVLEDDDVLEFYSSDTDLNEPTKWQRFDATNVSIAGRYVQFDVTHFSLFAVVVKKCRPKVEACINNQSGGVLQVNENLLPVVVSFPAGCLNNDQIDASLELLYYDTFYVSEDDMQTNGTYLAGPVVALGPNGCQFNHPVKITIPLPKARDIQTFLGYTPTIKIMCSQTTTGVSPKWEPYSSEYTIDLQSEICSVTFEVSHFTLFSVGWKILDAVLPDDLKLHASSHVPHFTFWVVFHAFMSDCQHQNKFGLCVLCSRFGNANIKKLPQYPVEVGSCKPRKIKTGRLQTMLKSGMFSPDNAVGETSFEKEINFVGHDFDVHYACVTNPGMISTGLFGKVELCEIQESDGSHDERFSFNLIKSVQPCSPTKSPVPSQWESKAIQELAGLLSIDDHMWQELALALGYNRHEMQVKFAGHNQTIPEMLADFMARGGEPDEFLNAMYRVARMFKLVPLDEMRENQQNRRLEAMASSQVQSPGPSKPLEMTTTPTTTTLKRKNEIICSNEPLTESKFDDIAGEIANRWKSIGRKLNVSEPELREIEMNYQHSGEKEKAFQMLIAWRERDPDHCSASALYTLLQDSGMKYTAMKCLT